MGVFLALLLALLAWTVWGDGEPVTAATLDEAVYARDVRNDYWFQLAEFAALPEPLTIATTEVGLPSVLRADWTIIDLSGLNEPAIVRQGFDPDWFFAQHAPDLIYLPHPHYVEMNAALLGHPAFSAEYDLYPAEEIGAEMRVALRRESSAYAAMQQIMARGLARGVSR
ncbi:MAG: hypothetical protein JW910_20405 [Anaerolineae bacterium]|nr:hypothetical protein [Anaerolineae bacterium]